MINMEDLRRALELNVIHQGTKPDLPIESTDINRPGLQLTGFMDFFPHERPQVLGVVEMAYLEQLTPELRRERLENIMAYDPPCMIISRNLHIPAEMLELAQKHDIWLFSATQNPTDVVHNLTEYLNDRLAPRITEHGVLVDVYGVGILITGESGVGKSETALELVKRGHRLVADDVVDIKRVSPTKLIGEAPEAIKHLMEIRGIGIIDVALISGVGAVLPYRTIDLVVHLEMWQQGKDYDRLGMHDEFTSILDVKLPYIELPVRPGRNLAIVLEVAARNQRLHEQGYNAAQVLEERMMARMSRKEE